MQIVEIRAGTEMKPTESIFVPQPIVPLDLSVKVRSWELTFYPQSYIRGRLGVTRLAKARM
jgi:hypothetical protein